MQKILSRSLSDILSPMVLSFVFKIGIGSILLWVVLLWVSWDAYEAVITSYIAKIPFVGSWEWIQSGGSFVVALIIGYMLIITTISIATSLFSEPILIALAKKHYPDQPIVGTANIATSISISIKASLVFLITFLISFPLIFIPILGQIWMLWLWSLLIKEPNTYDVGSLFATNKSNLKAKGVKSGVIAMLASLFNYIPLLNIFAPLFGQILFLHKILLTK